MGRNNNQKKKSNTNSSKSDKKSGKKRLPSEQPQEGEDGLFVDPRRVRFQHSKIRPFFSGCGRSVVETLESIRRKELSPSDLPPIQVLVGPETEDGPWYFSLNNRRLWILKRCQEEGLLESNRIYVRVRQPKSEAEALRYTVNNCALDAKIIPEKIKKRTEVSNRETENKEGPNDSLLSRRRNNTSTEANSSESQMQDFDISEESKSSHEQSESDSEDDLEDVTSKSSNRFSAFL